MSAPFWTLDGDASPTLGSLTALLGADAVARLSEHFGGRRVYVPATLGAGHVLAEIIGLELAQQLSANFAGATLALPITPGRRARIIALAAEGLPKTRIAEMVSLTERRVFQVLAEEAKAAEDASKQPSLPF